MSEHKLDIDIQDLANAVQDIRAACDKIESIIEVALLKDCDTGKGRES